MNARLLLLVAAAAVAVPVVANAGSTDGGVRRRAPRPTAKQFARIELGRRLFFDPQVSRSEARSCASCHAPDHGWSDPDPTSADDVGDTRRHSQTILDAAFNPSAHWDGEFGSVEDLVLARVGTPITGSEGGGYGGAPGAPADPVTPRAPRGRGPETGAPDRARPHGGGITPATPGSAPADPFAPARRPLRSEVDVPATVLPVVADRIQANGRYAEAFQAAFGSRKVTLARLATAIAAFVHSVESTTSPFDRHRAGETGALSAAAERGLALFEGRAGCSECHIAKGEHPLFTDFDFHNTGVAWDIDLNQFAKGSFDGLRARLIRGRLPTDADFRTAATALMDRGRQGITQGTRDVRAFKTPTLRDVARRKPYMHDGRFDTLKDVVRYYADGCGTDTEKDARLRGFQATPAEVDDLVAFLESLSGETRPGLTTKSWSRRVRTATLKFVDVEGRSLDRMDVELVPVGDPIPDPRANDERLALRTDGTGSVSYRPGARTHMRIVLPDEIPVEGGDLVPDTCDAARIVVPVSGRMSFLVTFPAQSTPPELIAGEHFQAPVLKGHPMKRTRFVRGPVVEVGGKKVARYEGWVRSDVGGQVALLVPGIGPKTKRANHLRFVMQAGAEIRVDLTDL